MKQFLIVLTLVLFSHLVSAKSTCRLQTGYGTFVGYGNTESVAFEKAAERCFDSMNIVKSKKSKNPDISEDQQLDFIDYCANLKCA
ncbi:MAG: hypothetical protein SGJ18_09755 [Pseudomonadota bacterium]|nr:hypothetical protein [Pseudomonadota bacterium]